MVRQDVDGNTPRLIDAWQEAPPIWDAVHYRVDQIARKDQFILTSSVTPNHKGILHIGDTGEAKDNDALSEAKRTELGRLHKKLTVLQYALREYTYHSEGEDIPDSVVETFVTRIVASKDGFDWYLRFDGHPDKPLHCQLDGKRKQTTKIMVSEDISPTMDNSPTGCHQGLIAGNCLF